MPWQPGDVIVRREVWHGRPWAGATARVVVDEPELLVTYTPPAGFLGNDTFTYTVTDSGEPALSAEATVLVTVVAGGFLDNVGASGGGCGCSAGPGLAALPWYGIPALLVLARRRRRKDGEGPAA